jgi:XTP/dITP diphosphohydrolase
VAPGLLSWKAWDRLRGADRVLTADPEHPQVQALKAAGIRVELPAFTARLAVDDLPQLARWLVELAYEGNRVVWLVSDDVTRPRDSASRLGGAELGEAVARELTDGTPGAGRLDSDRKPTVEVLAGSYDMPGSRLLDLVNVMDQLRQRCPWVRQQTHRSLVRYLVEEAYETVEAIETGDRQHLREELGDLLFQVIFHARLAEEHEADAWSIDDVTGDLVDKLIRRNPHVFGPEAAAGEGTHDVAAIEDMWDELKAEEKLRSSAVEGVPLALPALTLAEKLLSRTARDARLPRPDVQPASTAQDHALDGVLSKAAQSEESLGDLLLLLVEHARGAGLDAEQALRDACRRYIASVQAAER